ncbi:conserved hypothetical protein [Chthoniobacter flavus Ellin428]|uniref:PPM-type phosphatase domain-containing protein n=1 Tax=Chthoniobacter flavus Ellin428 TaxID=497964 RepID=B4CUT6_9BACT|nr:protein phosphatase 2C domain-containing protein [Chthoniobacter flavus]EDY22324.1 conserved hypothetical protein [Chthoniobacter flavus Ellin428]TCO94662.1 protein phosphatase 2C-like protein [Chthoniobacter flavus]
MHIHAQPFWVQKFGNSREEYEDAHWPRRRIDRKASHFRFAVADGATETSFSALWARLLIWAYQRADLPAEDVSHALSGYQKMWSDHVGKKPLPWFAEEKVRQGAFSSILGLSLSETSESTARGDWQSIAVGDSCLCQVRNDSLVASFPLESAAEFNSRPTLLSSNPQVRVEESQIQERKGEWESGDSFFLMTDALACWFLEASVRDERPWEILCGFDGQGEPDAFSEWVQQLRQGGAMKNDDVTLVRITVE